MDGTFELNKIGWYTPKNVAENDFLNEKNSQADLAKFGKTYSVSFEGDAETYLWTTKTRPEEGKRYWGHIQETSGKMLRFKVDKQEDGHYSTGPAIDKDNKYLKDISDLPDRWMARLLPYYDAQSLVKEGRPTEQFRKLVETAQIFTDESIKMIDAIRGGSPESSVSIKEERADPPTPATGHAKFMAQKQRFQNDEPPIEAYNDGDYDEH